MTRKFKIPIKGGRVGIAFDDGDVQFPKIGRACFLAFPTLTLKAWLNSMGFIGPYNMDQMGF